MIDILVYGQTKRIFRWGHYSRFWSWLGMPCRVMVKVESMYQGKNELYTCEVACYTREYLHDYLRKLCLDSITTEVDTITLVVKWRESADNALKNM